MKVLQLIPCVKVNTLSTTQILKKNATDTELVIIKQQEPLTVKTINFFSNGSCIMLDLSFAGLSQHMLENFGDGKRKDLEDNHVSILHHSHR